MVDLEIELEGLNKDLAGKKDELNKLVLKIKALREEISALEGKINQINKVLEETKKLGILNTPKPQLAKKEAEAKVK